MSSIITRVNTCLEDRTMNLYNHKKKQVVIVSPQQWGEKDRKFEQIKSALIQAKVSVSDEYVIPDFTPIGDQLNVGSCVANTWCDMLEILMGLENPNAVKQLSRLFLYWVARYLTGIQFEDRGTYNRAAAYQLRKVGIIEEKWFPYDTSMVFTSPELDLYSMASNCRIDSYYNIGSTGTNKLDDVETAVRANHPVAIGTVVAQEFMRYRGGGHVFHIPSTWEGRHAMIVIGVRTVDGRRQFLLRNSWSKNWGDNGYAWVDEDYIESELTRDLWAATRMKLI